MVWLNIVGLFVQYTRPEGALARGRGDVQSCNWGWRGARQGKNLQINNNIERGITREKKTLDNHVRGNYCIGARVGGKHLCNESKQRSRYVDAAFIYTVRS